MEFRIPIAYALPFFGLLMKIGWRPVKEIDIVRRLAALGVLDAPELRSDVGLRELAISVFLSVSVVEWNKHNLLENRWLKALAISEAAPAIVSAQRLVQRSFFNKGNWSLAISLLEVIRTRSSAQAMIDAWDIVGGDGKKVVRDECAYAARELCEALERLLADRSDVFDAIQLKTITEFLDMPTISGGFEEDNQIHEYEWVYRPDSLRRRAEEELRKR